MTLYSEKNSFETDLLFQGTFSILSKFGDDHLLQTPSPVCQDCVALRVIKLSHTFHFNFLSHITDLAENSANSDGDIVFYG